MKKSRFSEAQIVGILKEVEMGAKVAEHTAFNSSRVTVIVYVLPETRSLQQQFGLPPLMAA